MLEIKYIDIIPTKKHTIVSCYADEYPAGFKVGDLVNLKDETKKVIEESKSVKCVCGSCRTQIVFAVEL